ncbi:MAG: DNA polymerase III subunit alpha, partial [bacterium]
GLIALSACEEGEIASHIVNNDYRSALRASSEYAEILGKDNFFLEIQDHGTERDKKINEGMSKLASETGIGLVATNNVHYIREEHSDAHAVLMCLKSQTVMSDPNRPRFQGEGYHFKSTADMKALFAWAPHAVTLTSEIAGRCDVQIKFGDMHFPSFPVPGCGTARSHLETLCATGLHDRYGEMASVTSGNHRKKEILDRARHELDIIEKTGFANYFLVVWDFVQFARQSGIPVGLRGAGGASIVAYALGITEIDPLRYDLIFEGFLSPDRIVPPDFDIDFCQARRGEVISYLRGKYPGRVAHIASFSPYSARVAVRDTARVLEIGHENSDRILRMLPDDQKMTLKTMLSRHPGLAMMCEDDPACSRLISCATVLEGLCRNTGTHASGIVISDKALSELVPLALDKDNQPITQYSMEHLGEIGLLKMDLLGLRTLTVIKETVDLVSDHKRNALDLERIPPNDPETLHLLNCGNTIGVFQLESSGIRELLRRIGVAQEEDLIAILALYRPGSVHILDEYIARKTGTTPPSYVHPLLHTALADTFGVIIYQEQIIRSAGLLAGYSNGQADLLRRAICGKDVEIMEAQRGRFLKGCAKAHRIQSDKASDIFDHLTRFAEYSVSKAHSAACSILSYRTAYLKANHPTEFMAALLSSEMGDTGKLQTCINEACAMGLSMLPPHINDSDSRFLPIQGGVRCGLGAIRNIGASTLEAILKERRTNGRFADLTDFCIRTNNLSIHRKAIEILVRSGCFDAPLMHRARLYKGLCSAMSYAERSQRDKRNGQVSLFSASGNSVTGRIPLKDEDVMP